MANRVPQPWIAHYAASHRHPVNRACHTLGIPLIVLSLALAAAAILYHRLLAWSAIFFLLGWTLQFIGHAFERKLPEFLHDWRFLWVGVRWWWAKLRGEA